MQHMFRLEPPQLSHAGLPIKYHQVLLVQGVIFLLTGALGAYSLNAPLLNALSLPE